MNKQELEEKIIETLKTVYDPEIPVNIYELGLIYSIEILEGNDVKVTMTLTAPNCPMADMILEEVNEKVNAVEGVEDATVILTFEPEWNKDMMSEEAKLELGFF